MCISGPSLLIESTNSYDKKKNHYSNTTMICNRVFLSFLSIIIVVITFIGITLFNCYKTLEAKRVIAKAFKCIGRCVAKIHPAHPR